MQLFVMTMFAIILFVSVSTTIEVYQGKRNLVPMINKKVFVGNNQSSEALESRNSGNQVADIKAKKLLHFIDKKFHYSISWSFNININQVTFPVTERLVSRNFLKFIL